MKFLMQLVSILSFLSFFSPSQKSVATAFLSSPDTKARVKTWRNFLSTLSQRSVQSRLGSLTKYSESTQKRLEGMDAAEEFVKLYSQLKTSPEDLIVALTARRAAAINDVEKKEYVDWLLTGSNVVPINEQPPTPKKIVSKRKSATNQEEQTFATNVLFGQREDIHPNSKRAVAKMGLELMTEIQDKTFQPASTGRDVLGRARTGTGKTVAFLLPAIERILQLGIRPGQIGILAVSPTRELATQIGDEAEKLTAFHRDMSVQVMFGGTNTKRDISRLTKRMPTILVATPGRLLDHLKSARIGNLQFGKDIMSQTPIVILDEADRLLEMGFRREISKILQYMPRAQERQTLLFSATIPSDLKVIMAQNMKKDYVEVDCINDGDAATQTNAQVQQSHVIIPSNSGRDVSSVVELVRHAWHGNDNEETPAKIVVFFPTARLVNFYAELFNEGKVLPMPVLELHSKKSQGYRNRVSEEFRQTQSGVLFTSDVSARGVDYPNVSHVIQFGMPESREQYIHRLGRTGRGGTEGKGWLVLSQWESMFLQELKGVDIPVNEDLLDIVSCPIGPESEELMENIRGRIANNDRVLSASAKGAYQAFLGYYLGQMKRMRMKRKEQLVDIANDFAALSGLREPPALTKNMVGKMGLKGIPGLNVGEGPPQSNGGRSYSKGRGHTAGRRPPGKQGGQGRGRRGGR